jgi:hypothetical protein
MPGTRLYDMKVIAQTLGLLNPPMISQILRELREHRQRTKFHEAPDARYRKWHTYLLRVQMVEDDTGQPMVQFEQFVPEESTLSEESTSAEASSQLARHTDFSDLSEEMLAACRLVPVYIDEVLVAVVSERMRPGDIIIQSNWFELVLRPHDDGNKFVVVGDVCMAGGIWLANRAPFANECGCHGRLWPKLDLSEREYIEIAIEITDEEALAAVISREATRNGHYDMSEYLESGTSEKPELVHTSGKLQQSRCVIITALKSSYLALHTGLVTITGDFGSSSGTAS